MSSDQHRQKRSCVGSNAVNSDQEYIPRHAESPQGSLLTTVMALQSLTLNEIRPFGQQDYTRAQTMSGSGPSVIMPTSHCQPTPAGSSMQPCKKRPRPIYMSPGEHDGGGSLASGRVNQQQSLPFTTLVSEAERQISPSNLFSARTRPTAANTPMTVQRKSIMAAQSPRFSTTGLHSFSANLWNPYVVLRLPDLPSNHYTSPNRVRNAALIAVQMRKQGWPALPPPAYIFTRTNNPDFKVFSGILLYPELCFALAANLPVDDLLSLYAISKDFHTIIDTRFATVILSQSLRKCPDSSRNFPFRCYKYLCEPDPAPRIPHPNPTKHAAGEVRKVPGFRWLKMVMFRDKVCHEIMALMAEDGLPLPSRCESALKKLWFLMDLPDNARRVGYMHSKQLVSDLDLYFMMCFIVKLDLRFNDPVATNRHHGLKKIILAQRGLLPLWRLLKRNILRDRYDIMKMWTATKHVPPGQEEGLKIFGIAAGSVGKLRLEYWGAKTAHDTGKPCTVLMRPDQLMMREIIRRQLIFSKHFLRCLLWGYIDISTLDKYPPRAWQRKFQHLEDEYADDDECGGRDIATNGVEDELLDLGAKKPISLLVQQNGK